MVRLLVSSMSIVWMLVICSCRNDSVGELEIDPLEGIDLAQACYVEIEAVPNQNHFRVKFSVKGLKADQNIFQAAAVVPGSYQLGNFGQFFKNVQAYDANGDKIEVVKVQMNQWRISDPEKLTRLEYTADDTFDTNPAILTTSGSTVEEAHSLLNLNSLVGYIANTQNRPYYLKLNYPSSWRVSTSLQSDENAIYRADSYYHLVDAPILAGSLTNSIFSVDDRNFTISVVSEKNILKADNLLPDAKKAIIANHAFLKSTSPSNYYFLFLFSDMSGGGMEHHNSSVYVQMEEPYSTDVSAELRTRMAHEYFHKITPLGIKSNKIEPFNFAEPTASQHVWFYEGVTVWASYMMQYRNQTMPLDELLLNLQRRVIFNTFFDFGRSLTESALACYTGPRTTEVYAAYYRGAIVAALVDILLLEKSNGQSGLRELLMVLQKSFDQKTPFNEDQFFSTLTDDSIPELEEFLNLYVKGNATLPITEYFAKIGILFNPNDRTFTKVTIPTKEQSFLFDRWSVNF